MSAIYRNGKLESLGPKRFADLMHDEAYAEIARDVAELSASPALFHMADTIDHALSEYEIERASQAAWAKPARDAGLPWAWRLRVGNYQLIGGCPTRKLCAHQVKAQRRKLKALARGRMTNHYGRKAEEAR